MNATIKYRMEFKSSTLIPDKLRQDGVQAWVIVRRIEDRRGKVIAFEDVAIFNFDSAAQDFQRHVFDGGAIEISPDLAEHFQLVDKALDRNNPGQGQVR